MRWDNPLLLLGLWILPFLAVLLIHAHQRRSAAAQRFAQSPMVKRLMPAADRVRPWVRGGLLLLGVALLIVAAARPRFGVYFEQVAVRGVDLFVLLDVSRSMLAEDVAPNRLGRAKSDIRDLLRRLPGDRVGLIAFAGAPSLIVPLTTDQGFFLSALEAVDPGSAPRGGSLIGDAIRKAIQSLPERRDSDQAIVLITDGEDHDSFPLEAAEQAAQRGIRIFAVGLGDPLEGTRIPLREDSGDLRYLKYEGEEVRSRMDERLLKEIAFATEGAYIPAQTQTYDLGDIYQRHLAGLTRSEVQTEKRKRYAERFPWFVFFGLAALLLQTLLPPYPASPSQPPAETGPASAPKRTRTGKRRAAATLGIALIVWPGTAQAGIGDAVRAVREGIRLFRGGDYQAAAQQFAAADVALPEDPRILFDLACAEAAQGDLEKAAERFEKAALARDVRLAAAAHYNLGTLAARRAKDVFGEKPEEASPEVRQQGLDLLFAAAAHFRDCLDRDPDHEPARHNLELIRQWIKQMQDLWAQRDRQQQREEMNLLELLEMIQTEQQRLRGLARILRAEEDSPRRRQAVMQAAAEQRRLTEEIPPLKDKIREALQPQAAPGSAPTASPAPGPDTDKAIEVLHGLADQAGQAMNQAARQLDDQTLEEAAESQAAALDALNDIYLAAAPFADLLGKATGLQQSLLDASKQIVEPPPETPAPNAQEPPAPDYEELARSQSIVHRWSRILPRKAEQELQQMPAVPAGPPQRDEPAAPPPDGPQAMQQWKPALEKAVELGSKIEEQTGKATDLLQTQQAAEALPPQEEALRMLKEIADLLPKQPPQQPEEQPQQPPQEQPQQDQADPPSPQPSPGEQEMSREQAETLMRQVRQRERLRRDLEKQLQRYRQDGIFVDRDW